MKSLRIIAVQVFSPANGMAAHVDMAVVQAMNVTGDKPPDRERLERAVDV